MLARAERRIDARDGEPERLGIAGGRRRAHHGRPGTHPPRLALRTPRSTGRRAGARPRPRAAPAHAGRGARCSAPARALPRGRSGAFLLSVMRVAERVKLAGLAYAMAIARARSESTAASWARLLRAARNLHAAKRERDALASGGGVSRAGSAVTARGGGRTRRDGASPQPAVAGSGRREAPSRRHGAPLRIGSPVPDPLAALAQLRSECERSHALREWSRRLVLEARALRASIAEQLALGRLLSTARPSLT